jgi:predicted ArsR family transcriptional regulator
MPGPPASLPTARLSVLDRIRRGDRTVNAIAAALGVTDNAVRLHVSALERDGLVRLSGVVRSGQAGKPAAEYELAPDGEIALSSAYPPALTAVMSAIGARLDARAVRALLLDAGKRLASHTRPHDTGSVASRANSCAALLESLGGSATVTHARGHTVLTGTGCPLASAVRAEPGTCALVEALLAKSSGLSVTQKCDHGENPSCRFELCARS